jgi:hypothetical protein
LLQIPSNPPPNNKNKTKRPATDGAELADAITAKIDRSGCTAVCCSGLDEASKALVAMAEAREWLQLYRLKDFSAALAVAGAGGAGGGANAGVEGWPVTFWLLECRWNCMTYFKY